MTKIIIGFSGEMASGKGTCAKYFVEHHDAVTYRFSTPLRDVVKRLHLPEDRGTIQHMSTTLRTEFGEDLLAKVIFGDVQSDTHELVVVDGVRRPDDVKYLRQLPEFKLVYIEAPMETRHERIVLRGENADDTSKTWEQFQKDHESEPELQIKDLKQLASDVVDNSGDLNALHAQLDTLFAKYRGA